MHTLTNTLAGTNLPIYGDGPVFKGIFAKRGMLWGLIRDFHGRNDCQKIIF